MQTQQMTSVFTPEEQAIPAGMISPHLQEALKDLTSRFESSTDIARREYVRRVLKNHELFRGNMWRWFDYQTGSWRAYNSATGGMTNAQGGTDAQSLYTINFFQGYALSLISLLSGNKMTVKWWPQNARSPEDIEAAKKCDAVMRWFKSQEKTHTKLVKMIYLLWTDGTFGSYVRSVADGDRFGWIEEPVYEEVERQVGEAQYQCEVCQTINEHGIGCANCGAPLPIEPNVPAPVIREQVPVGLDRKPKSRTTRDVAGGLELKLPPTAEDISEFPYLIRSREVPKANVRATWPEMAKQVQGGQVGSPRFDGATSTVEKRARLQVAHGLTADNRPVPIRTADYVTLTEAWFSRKAFFELDDEQLRDELLRTFPKGCYVAFADDTFLEARDENMMDHWRICHALPGNGQIREPIGGSLVQVQEMANDLANIIRDVIEYTLPVTFIDSQVLDLRKWARSNVLAGAAYPARALPGQPLGGGFHQTEPGRLPEYAVGFFNDLRNSIAQFVSGVFPAAYGGASPGNETAQGREIERNSALGRISMFLRALTEHEAAIGELVVKDFKKNAEEAITVVSKDQFGDFKTDRLEPQDLQTGEAHTYPELDEDYPTTWPQRQALLLQMMGNPMFQSVFTMLSNADSIRQTMGHDLQLPGEAQYRRAFKVIKDLLSQQPIEQPPQPMLDQMGQPMVDPMTGQPAMQPMPPLPSIPPDLLDDAIVNLTAGIDFAFSEDGEQAKVANQPGWMNFMCWVQANHDKLAMGQPNALTPPPPSMPPQGPPPQ